MRLSEYVGTFSAILIAFVPTITKGEAKNMTGCTPSIEPGITVTVSDAQTGTPLKATIIVKDASFHNELKLRGVTAAGQIIYGGVFERPGVYTVITSRDGYESFVMEEVKVDQDECHVITRNLRVALKPINGR